MKNKLERESPGFTPTLPGMGEEVADVFIVEVHGFDFDLTRKWTSSGNDGLKDRKFETEKAAMRAIRKHGSRVSHYRIKNVFRGSMTLVKPEPRE